MAHRVESWLGYSEKKPFVFGKHTTPFMQKVLEVCARKMLEESPQYRNGKIRHKTAFLAIKSGVCFNTPIMTLNLHVYTDKRSILTHISIMLM